MESLKDWERTIEKTGDRPLQAHLNPTVKSTQFAIDDPPPTPLVESYQSKPLFFQEPIGDRVVPDSSASLLPSQF
jgi:hypothetical protein